MIRTILVAIAALTVLPLAAGAQEAKTETAIFSGGCFWCVESDFDHIPGVLETISGFTGGHVANPSYDEVSAGGTGHRESVKITFDPAKVGYATLVKAFFHSVDPTDPGGQFCDRGPTYTTAVYVLDDTQRKLAEAAKAAAQKELGKPVVTEIATAGPFYPAEDYHQGYYQRNPLHYKFYRWNCGRNMRVEQIWGDHAYEGIPDHS